jgi:hypothetical protein
MRTRHDGNGDQIVTRELTTSRKRWLVIELDGIFGMGGCSDPL